MSKLLDQIKMKVGQYDLTFLTDSDTHQESFTVIDLDHLKTLVHGTIQYTNDDVEIRLVEGTMKKSDAAFYTVTLHANQLGGFLKRFELGLAKKNIESAFERATALG